MAIGLPYEIAFMVTTGLNLLPMLAQNIATTMSALQARGVPWQGGLSNKIKALRYLLFPVMVGILRHSRQMADGSRPESLPGTAGTDLYPRPEAGCG